MNGRMPPNGWTDRREGGNSGLDEKSDIETRIFLVPKGLMKYE